MNNYMDTFVGNVSMKKLNKDITLLKETLDCIESIERVCRTYNCKSIDDLSNKPDILASANFQLIQISRNIRGMSKYTVGFITKIDIPVLMSVCANLIWDYPKTNRKVIICFIKNITCTDTKKELKMLCDSILECRTKLQSKQKKKITKKKKVA